MAGYASTSGALVLWADAPSDGTSRPYAALQRALAPLMQPAVDATVSNVAAALLTMLFQLNSTPGMPHATLTGSSADDPLHGTITRSLGRLAAYAPVVLVVDDVQAVDEAMVAFLLHLRQERRDGPLLVLATSTPHTTIGNTQNNVERLLMAMRSQDKLDVAPLHAAERAELVRVILGGPVDAHVQAVVRTVAGGHPFFIEETITALQGRGYLYFEQGTWRLRKMLPAGWDRGYLRHKR